jgi:hypothetical protein
VKPLMIELFSGSKRMASAFEAKGFRTITIDNQADLTPDIVTDILALKASDITKERPSVIWASPPCTTFSIASFGHHWAENYTPKTEECRIALKLVAHVLTLIRDLDPEYFFIENPMGMMRKLPAMQPYEKYRKLTTFCQYGEPRMKPTDIWTNAPINFPKCKNGDLCHPRTPRGCKTVGTQAMKGAYERAALPEGLCELVANSCSTFLNNGKPKTRSIMDYGGNQ